jgi:hypothetical protein
MKRFYDYDTIVRDVTEALRVALEPHQLDIWHPLALCAVIEAAASPLKAQVAGPLLMRKVGRDGVDVYLASRLAQRVEVLKSPSSEVVNPMMDAIVLALLKKGAIPQERLFREALKVYLGLSGRPKAEIDASLGANANLGHTLNSALNYLQEGGVVERSADGTQWQLIA